MKKLIVQCLFGLAAGVVSAQPAPAPTDSPNPEERKPADEPEKQGDETPDEPAKDDEAPALTAPLSPVRPSQLIMAPSPMLIVCVARI